MNEKDIKHVNLRDAEFHFQTEALGTEGDVLFLDDISKFSNPQRPRRLGFIAHVLCEQGHARFRLNSQPMELRAGELLIGTGEQVIDSCEWTSDFKGRFMLISARYTQDSVVGLQRFLPYLIFLLERPVIQLSAEESEHIVHTFSLIQRRLSERDNPFQRDVVGLLLRMYYYDVCRFLHRRYWPQAPLPTRSMAIFERFIRLLSQNYRQQRELTWYSSQLCLSPKYLSGVVKKVSGRTAGQWITLIVMVEIKTYLSCSDYSIKEIAEQLHFPSQSFLGKYFKAATGMSPTEYRQQNAG